MVTAVGWEFDCADEFVGMRLDVAKLVISVPRDLAHFGVEIPVRADASVRQRFLGYLGRRVVIGHVLRNHSPGNSPSDRDPRQGDPSGQGWKSAFSRRWPRPPPSKPAFGCHPR
jgi:hypothetical protein